MTITLRIILIICSLISFLLCVTKIKQAKLKVENSVTWMISAISGFFSGGTAKAGGLTGAL